MPCEIIVVITAKKRFEWAGELYGRFTGAGRKGTGRKRKSS